MDSCHTHSHLLGFCQSHPAVPGTHLAPSWTSRGSDQQPWTCLHIQSLILAAIAYCRCKFWTFYHHKIVLNHSILMVLMALYMVEPSLRYKPVFGMHPMHPPCTLHAPSILTAIFSLSSDPFTARLWPIGRRVKGLSIEKGFIGYGLVVGELFTD